MVIFFILLVAAAWLQAMAEGEVGCCGSAFCTPASSSRSWLSVLLMVMTGISARFADDVVDLVVDWWRNGARAAALRAAVTLAARRPCPPPDSLLQTLLAFAAPFLKFCFTNIWRKIK
jgi:hypothetical protein